MSVAAAKGAFKDATTKPPRPTKTSPDAPCRSLWASVPTRVREVRGTAVSRPLSHDGVLDATTSPVTADAWVRRTGQVDCHVVARTS